MNWYESFKCFFEGLFYIIINHLNYCVQEYHIQYDLNESIIARDKKITTLENYVNNLEDEIRKLQNNLNEVVESGEEIKKLSYEKINETQKMLEAHRK